MGDVSPIGEVWWIFSARTDWWAGLRIAHFAKAKNTGEEIFVIVGEAPTRQGVRLWSDVSEREGWVKIEQITVPDLERCKALAAGLRNP